MTTPQAIILSAVKEALSRILEVSEDSGTATGGTNTTLEDGTKNWETDMWINGTIHIFKNGTEYLRTVSANTATTITFAALPPGVEVAAGDSWAIRRPIAVADISDRATRLLGIIYGSQGQQLLQRATTYDLLMQLRHAGVEIDPRDIRTITEVLPVKDTTQRLVAASVAAGTTTNVDIGPITDRTGMLVILRCTYDAGATAGVRLRYLYSPDGANFDNWEDADAEGNYFEPSFAAGATRQRSVVIPFLSPYVRLAVSNLDPTYAVGCDLWTVEVK